MWKVTYCKGWGTRLPQTYTSLYFSKKPSVDKIIESFKERGIVSMKHSWFRPEKSGLVTTQKIEVI